MQAIVTNNKYGSIRVQVRRSSQAETLDGLHTDLSIGDKVEVKRVSNNPFLVRVKE